MVEELNHGISLLSSQTKYTVFKHKSFSLPKQNVTSLSITFIHMKLRANGVLTLHLRVKVEMRTVVLLSSHKREQ